MLFIILLLTFIVTVHCGTSFFNDFCQIKFNTKWDSTSYATVEECWFKGKDENQCYTVAEEISKLLGGTASNNFKCSKEILFDINKRSEINNLCNQKGAINKPKDNEIDICNPNINAITTCGICEYKGFKNKICYGGNKPVESVCEDRIKEEIRACSMIENKDNKLCKISNSTGEFTINQQ